jgi:hypothetical protein
MEVKSMNIKFVLGAAGLLCFMASPVLAQHGAGHGGGAGSARGASAHGNADKGSSSKGSSVSDKLADNTKLSNKLQGLLPSGTNLQNAAQGFKNLGQFVAAVHVSHNLGIPFDQLKTKMIGPPKESLGKAIQALKPAANSKEEAKKGEQEAKQDLDDSSKTS